MWPENSGHFLFIEMINKIKKTDWFEYLKDEFEKEYFQKLEKYLIHEYDNETIYPPKEFIFNALIQTSLKDTKVVILGQDPYHGHGQAHGLSFSVPEGIKPPPSLVNIFKEMESDISNKVVSGNLLNWAQQGVLLLNNTLTVRAAQAGSHQKKGWEIFTSKIIDIINENKKNVVFILWGSPAQKKASSVDKSKHLVIESVHPSPLSSYRGFFGSKPFSKTNEYLISHGLKPINW